jgi:hypothetical protein
MSGEDFAFFYWYTRKWGQAQCRCSDCRAMFHRFWRRCQRWQRSY